MHTYKYTCTVFTHYGHALLFPLHFSSTCIFHPEKKKHLQHCCLWFCIFEPQVEVQQLCVFVEIFLRQKTANGLAFFTKANPKQRPEKHGKSKAKKAWHLKAPPRPTGFPIVIGILSRNQKFHPNFWGLGTTSFQGGAAGKLRSFLMAKELMENNWQPAFYFIPKKKAGTNKYYEVKAISDGIVVQYHFWRCSWYVVPVCCFLHSGLPAENQVRPRLCAGDSSMAGLPDRQENEPEPQLQHRAERCCRLRNNLLKVISLCLHPYTSIYHIFIIYESNSK